MYGWESLAHKPNTTEQKILIGCSSCGDTWMVDGFYYKDSIPPIYVCNRCGTQLQPATREMGNYLTSLEDYEDVVLLKKRLLDREN